jgi:hypothetical protein
MSKLEKLVVTKQYLDAENKWVQILGSGESLSILFPPVSDCQRRISQFITEHNNEFLFLEVNPLDLATEELIDLEKSLLIQVRLMSEFKKFQSFESLIHHLDKNKRHLVITCPLADFLFTQKGKHYLSLIQKIIFEYTPTLTCFLAFETDIIHPDSAELVRNYHMLFQHIDYYPLYSSTDTSTFINYLCLKWEIKMKTKVKQEIIEKCGGYFWLVKEALRQIRDTGSWDINSESFQYRLQTIAQSLKESEYITIAKILSKNRGFDDVQLHSRKYLQKIRLLDNKSNLTVPLLKDTIIKLGASKRKLILIKNEIFLNQVPVSNFFSRKEFRIIKLLLSREGETVTRDEIADVIWLMDVKEKYSEWAIDQLVKRLRNRLSELLIPKTVIRSVRGKGYCYVQS